MALAFDALIGDPDWLWRRLAHPVALIGRAHRVCSTARSIAKRWPPAQTQVCRIATWSSCSLPLSALLGFVVERVSAQSRSANRYLA